VRPNTNNKIVPGQIERELGKNLSLKGLRTKLLAISLFSCQLRRPSTSSSTLGEQPAVSLEKERKLHDGPSHTGRAFPCLELFKKCRQ
jgi:hypothetical protein